MKLSKFNLEKEIMATICVFRLDPITIVERFSINQFEDLIFQYVPTLQILKLIYQYQIEFAEIEAYEHASICQKYIQQKKEAI